MPELPEVQTIVTILQSKLPGRRIDQVVLNRRDIVVPDTADLTQLLTRRTIASITRRAKRIIFHLDNDNRFYIHLGMSGRLTLEAATIPYRPHTHLILKFANDELRFVNPRRFGGVFWRGQSPTDENLGPEPLTIRPSQLAARLSKTKRAIKSALLDQSLLAGLGNIYVDESLFTAKIHPQTAAHQLTKLQISALTRSIKSTLKKALRHKGSTLRDYRDADGNSGNFQSLHRVSDREGKPCPTCGKPIQRIILGGRSTHFCVKCQQPPPKQKQIQRLTNQRAYSRA